MGKLGLDRSGSGQGQVVGACECGNEPWGSIKCGEFLDWMELLASQEGLCSMQLVSWVTHLFMYELQS